MANVGPILGLFLLLSCPLYMGLFHPFEAKASGGYPVHNLSTGLDYATIQGAIDAPETVAGHIILVGSGFYNESVFLPKSLKLMGENPKTTIISCPATRSVGIYVTAHNATITGFTVEAASETNVGVAGDYVVICNNIIGPGGHEGIRVSEGHYAEHNTIVNNTIVANKWNGIVLGGDYNGVFNNKITNNSWPEMLLGAGIQVLKGSSNVIENNSVIDGVLGILLQQSTNNTLKGNEMLRNVFDFGVDGNELQHFLHSIDSSNRVAEGAVFYLVNQSDLTIDQTLNGENVAYLGLVNSNNITARNVALTHNFQGLLLAYTNNSFVENACMLDNADGVDLVGSFRNTLHNCTIAQSGEQYRTMGGDGVCFSGSNENTIEVSSITSTGQHGISLGNSRYNNVRSSEISHSYFCGFILGAGAIGNIIENNSVRDNEEGIRFWEGFGRNVNNNTFRGNTLVNNIRGVVLEPVANNTFYHNNFLNNAHHIDTSIYFSGNTWDNGFEGNYWDDCTEKKDSNNDGINDNPYTVAGTDRDRFPLLGLFSSFNTSAGHPVEVISNSTVQDFAYFHSNSSIRLTVSNITKDQTYGFIRLTIPHAVMFSPYTVIVNQTSVPYTTVFENQTLCIIYFNYQHSIDVIILVSESSQLIILPVFIVGTLLTVTVSRRKHAT